MRSVHKAIVLICFLILNILYLNTPEKPNASFQRNIFIVLIISSIALFMFQKIGNKQFRYFSITPIFILGYIIVFFQIPLLRFYGFEIKESLFNFIWANDTVINKSIIISGIGLLSFYLGLMFFRKGTTNNIIIKKETKDSGRFLIILTYAFYFLFFISSGSYKTGEYTPEDASGLVNYFSKFFNIFLSAAIILKVSNITSLSNKKMSFKRYLLFFEKPLLIILFWHLIFSMFVGDRGPIIYYLMMTFSMYFLRFKEIGVIKIAFIIFMSSVFFTGMGIVRQTRGGDKGYIERVTGVFQIGGMSENNIGFDTSVPGGTTIELAISIRTLNYSIYNVPNKFDYGYGIFQSKYFFSIIPGLSGIMLNLIHNGDPKYNGSSNFITYLIQGKDSTYGDGSSIVADLYLDFGVYGVIIGLFLFGAFIGKNENKLFTGHQEISIVWIALIVYFSLAIYVNRSALLLQLSKIIMIYIALKMNYFIINKNKLFKKNL